MRAGRASVTARVVAVGRAVGVEGVQRDPLVARLLPPQDRVVVGLLRALGAGRAGATGGLGHAALRMAAVDRSLADAVAEGAVGQVVVLGAGWDTRAWRLAALAGRRVLEVDHPATQARKRRVVADVAPLAAAVQFVAADLAVDDLDAVLDDAGHDAALPTVWLWEAVVPYLPESAVEATLRVVSTRSAPSSRLLLTTVGPALVDPAPPRWMPLTSLARAGMQALGEPVLLAEDDAAVAVRLARHGFTTQHLGGPRSWARTADVRVSGPVLDERLHVAVRG